MKESIQKLLGGGGIGGGVSPNVTNRHGRGGSATSYYYENIRIYIAHATDG